MSAGLKIAIGAFACLVGGWFVGGLGAGESSLTFLSVGQGDCAVIQSGHDALLIDAGPSERVARWQILPKLRALGVGRVLGILISHPDLDHVGGVHVLARQFPEAKILISREFESNEEWLRLEATWGLDSDRFEFLPRKSSGRFADMTLQIYCPEMPNPKVDNDGSMFVKVTRDTASAVFSGDATAEAEVVASTQGDWRAEVMKAGHHGSKTSTSFSWLRAVSPKWFVVSCGKDNRYGHPHAQTIERATGAGASILRTDTDGDIHFGLQGNQIAPSQK